MTKKITKIGNSHGLIFDRALMDLARIQEGDEFILNVLPNRAITLIPVEPARKSEEKVSEAIQGIMERYQKTMQRLA